MNFILYFISLKEEGREEGERVLTIIMSQNNGAESWRSKIQTKIEDIVKTRPPASLSSSISPRPAISNSSKKDEQEDNADAELEEIFKRSEAKLSGSHAVVVSSHVYRRFKKFYNYDLLK